MPDLVHMAGPTLTYDGVRRQLCAWCGWLLEEVPLDGLVIDPPSFDVGVEVAVDLDGVGGASIYQVASTFDLDGTPRVHERSCMRNRATI